MHLSEYDEIAECTEGDEILDGIPQSPDRTYEGLFTVDLCVLHGCRCRA